MSSSDDARRSGDGPSGTRRRPQQRRSQEKVERILDAIEQLLIDSPVDDLTMKAILERSGVPPGTFYAYFEDRDAAVERLAFSYVEAATQMLAGWAANDAAGSWEESIVDLVRTYRRWALARPAFVRLWTAGQLGGALVEYEQSTNVYLATLLRSALERVEPDSELPEVVVRFTVELIDQMMRFAFREADADRFRVVEEELITAVIRYLGVHLPATADRIGRSSAGS